MDSITQMLFGATIGLAGFRKTLGRKAVVAGAILGSVPDLDVAVGFVAGPLANWEYHRSATHSLWFGPLIGPVIGYGLWRWFRKRDPGNPAKAGTEHLQAWIWLSILAILTHPLIDLFTSYGTLLLWPFSQMRFAINSMPIIDPVYSGILILGLLIGARKRTSPWVAQNAGAVALLLIGAYTAAGWAINHRVIQVAEAQFPQGAQFEAYPLVFQPYYRRVVARTPTEIAVGYYSVLNPQPIGWTRYPTTGGPEVEAVRATPEAHLFNWFAMGMVGWHSRPDGNGGHIVEATDLRYGMPGPSDRGFWGLQARVDHDKKLASPITTLSIPRDTSGAAFSAYWRAIVGE